MQLSQVRLEIGADPMEVGRARRWVRARLAGCGVAESDEQLAETVVLLVSELVTNAVVHTGRPAVLCLSLPGPGRENTEPGTGPGTGIGADPGAGTGRGAETGALRVEVVDASRTAPSPRHAEGEDTGGRGLELVSGLADRWGWHHEGEGKRIWCEFDGAPDDGVADGAAPGDAVAGAADTHASCAGPPRRDGAPVPPRPRSSLTLRPTR